MVMTPQLLQAIKLLQLPNVELAAYIENELERNPLLERAEEFNPSETTSEPAGLFATINAPPTIPTAVEQTGLIAKTSTNEAVGAINPTASVDASMSLVMLGIQQGGVNADGAVGSSASAISPYLLQSALTPGDTTDTTDKNASF